MPNTNLKEHATKSVITRYLSTATLFISLVALSNIMKINMYILIVDCFVILHLIVALFHHVVLILPHVDYKYTSRFQRPVETPTPTTQTHERNKKSWKEH